MRKINQLTPRGVQKLVAEGKRGTHNDGRGLYLMVMRPGLAYWIHRYSRNRRKHDKSLGSVHDWTLAEARERNRQCRQLRQLGRDPITDARAEKAMAPVASAKA